MISSALSDDPDYLEALYCAAEMKASVASPKPRRSADEGLQIKDMPNGSLKEIASRELSRIGLREKLLPSSFSSSIDWVILLDLYVNAGCSENAIGLDSSSDRWGVSRATAARYIAALIESNLILRSSTSEHGDKITLDLTGHGHATLTKVLTHYQKHAD